jgi:hypothetical protein
VSLVTGTQAVNKSQPVALASDQFSSLLESLDAIASAIQGVVESAAPVRKDPRYVIESEPSMAHDGVTAKEGGDASFEKEVAGLFALESHEWLAQIQTALKKLSEGPNGTVRPKLYGIILQGITNLAKSAATVQLPAIEHMASSLLPILHDVGRQEPRAAAMALNSLQDGLTRIATAVQRLTGVEDTQGATATLSDVRESVPAFSTSRAQTGSMNQEQVGTQVAVQAAAKGPSLLKALRDLQQIRARSVQPTRDVLEVVIATAERESGEIDVAMIKRILQRLDKIDEQFLEEIRRRIPVIVQALFSVRSRGATDFVTSSQLDPIVQEVDALHDLADRVQASMMTMFLQGLRSFLVVAAYRKTATLPQRLETVEVRMQTLVPIAEQWVSIGQIERAAISEILPV